METQYEQELLPVFWRFIYVARDCGHLFRGRTVGMYSLNNFGIFRQGGHEKDESNIQQITYWETHI